MLPYIHDDIEFWERLIKWSADRRVRLGVNSFDLLTTILDDLNWPLFDPPACPEALKRDAGRSLNRLLTRVRNVSTEDPDAPTPVLAPNHTDGDLVEEAIGRDAAALYDNGLIGLATSHGHWVTASRTVTFSPPPPEQLEFVCIPGALTVAQRDGLVKGYFAQRRLTIIGGRSAPGLKAALGSRFGIADARLRWVESEKGKTMSLDFLDSLRTERDIVFCVAGHIGHPETYSVKDRCNTLGVQLCLVEDQNEIIKRLESDFAHESPGEENLAHAILSACSTPCAYRAS